MQLCGKRSHRVQRLAGDTCAEPNGKDPNGAVAAHVGSLLDGSLVAAVRGGLLSV